MKTAWYKDPVSLQRILAISLLSVSIGAMVLVHSFSLFGFALSDQWPHAIIIVMLALYSGFGVYSLWGIKILAGGMPTLGEKGGWVFIVFLLTSAAFVAVLLGVGVKSSFGFFVSLTLSGYFLGFVVRYDFSQVQARYLRSKRAN